MQQQLLSGASHTHIARAVLASYTPALSELGICISRRTWCLRSCLHLGVPRATHRHSYTAVVGLPPVFCVLCLWLSASLCVNAHVNVTSQVHVTSNLARVSQTTAHGFRVAAHDQLLELSSPCGYQVAAFTLLSPCVNSARTTKLCICRAGCAVACTPRHTGALLLVLALALETALGQLRELNSLEVRSVTCKHVVR